MTLAPFKSKLLHFLYILTRQKRYLSNARLAEQMGVTRKTIDNWLDFFSEPYAYNEYQVTRKLSYFPHVVKSSLGLKTFTAFCSNPKWELAYTYPNKNFIGRLYDVEENCPVLAMECFVPMETVTDFKQTLQSAKNYGLCSEISCFETGPGFIVYSPFHRVVDQEGVFHFDKNDSRAIEYEISKLEDFFSVNYAIEMHPAIERNPLIVPLLGENMFELRTSTDIWAAMKRSLGEDIWSYFKNHEKRSDGIGIARIQQAKKLLHSMDLIAQMRVVYFPFEIGHNFFIWNLLKYANITHLLDIVTKVLEHSILVHVRRVGSNRALISYLLNGKAYQALFSTLSEQKILKTMIYDYSQWQELVTTTKYSVFDYTRMFDPEECKWMFNHEDLQHKMRSISETANN